MSILVRTKTFKNKDGSSREYLYLVDSYWDKEKRQPRQKNICNLGRTDDKRTSELVENLIRNLAKYTGRRKWFDVPGDLESLKSKAYGDW